MLVKIKIVLFLILAMGLVLYLYRSGVVGGLFSGLDSLFSREASSTGLFFPKFNIGSYGNTKSAPKPSVYSPPPPPPQPTPRPVSGQPAINSYEIPQGYALKDLSPYFHKIRIGSVSAGSNYFYGQVSLAANFSDSLQSGAGGSQTINVSGWHLQAREGDQFIPQAVDVYDPSGLTAESDIYLRSGDVLNIYTSQSAIGKNLHINKCLGFLGNTNNFTPSLPTNCPYISRSDVAGFSGECQDYVLSLGSCRLPGANPPVPENDYACRTYLNTINYKGCFDKYRSDSDFLSREWWIWSGARFLDERHDKILLLDRNGLLVDLYEY